MCCLGGDCCIVTICTRKEDEECSVRVESVFDLVVVDPSPTMWHHHSLTDCIPYYKLLLLLLLVVVVNVTVTHWTNWV